MGQSTRRAFVKNSMTAAAGMTAIGMLAAESADAEAGAESRRVVAYVRNARTGEISLMSGKRTVTVRDRQLAARIARAAR